MTALETISAPLIINLFGPMQILADGHLLPRLRSRKGIWLLALLALRPNRSVARDWLAETLWPDMEQSQAFANLRPILSELRAGLGSQKGRLQSPDRDTLRLELTGVEVDVLAFDAAIKSQKLTDLETAVTLYRGPLLEGCVEEWVVGERNAREQDCLSALHTLADAALTAGDYESAVRYYQRATVLDPWNDAVRRGWMEALAKKGDRNAALQVYREFLEALRDDSRASPDEQTTALYVRLRAEGKARDRSPAAVLEEPGTVPKITGYLPHPLTNLIGREDERLEVSVRLRRARLVTLTGLGGIGKTRLALEVAREISKEYADGVWLVALDALSEGRQVTAQIASVLEVKEEAGRSLLESVTRHLRPKRLLLVLDNCEHLLEACIQIIGHLLRECRELRILATSREALEIPGEMAWMVPTLATPESAHLPQGQATLLRVLMSYESVQLFVERAQAVQKAFVLDVSNARTIAQICFRLEGIPLAIELAAARGKAMTVSQIAARLDDELSLLTGGSRTAQSRQQTLRATLDWSYALLGERERRLLCRLSVFAGGWTLEAAEGVASGKGIEARAVPALLASLVDKSLVTFEEREQAGGGRYRLLEVVRQYAREKLQESEEVEKTETKHRDWFIALSETAEPKLTGAEQNAWIERLTMEYDNLRVAMACSGKDEVGGAGLRLTGALWRFWYIRGNYIEGQRQLQEALAHDTSQPATMERAKALHGMGVMLFRQGEYLAARKYHEQALSIREQIADRQGIGESFMNLGNVAFSLGEHTTARAFYERSLTIRRKLGDRHGIALILGNLGNLSLEKADFVEAKAAFEENLEIARALENKSQIAWVLQNLGIIASLHGDYALVQMYLKESISLFQALGERRGMAWSFYVLAGVDHDQCGYDSAYARYQEILPLVREIGDKHGIAWVCYELGMVAIDQADQKTARGWLTEGLRMFQGIGDKHGTASCLRGLGVLAYQEGDFAFAKTSLTESLRSYQALGNKRGVLESLEVRATLMRQQAESKDAVRLLAATRRLRDALGLPIPPNTQAKIASRLDEARTLLGADAYAGIWEEGYAMIWEQAIEFALAEKESEPFAEKGD